MQFLVKIFKKLPKNAFFSFKILPAARNLGQNRDFLVLSESSKNQFGRPKERRQNFQNCFENPEPPPPPPPPPLEKILDPPL